MKEIYASVQKRMSNRKHELGYSNVTLRGAMNTTEQRTNRTWGWGVNSFSEAQSDLQILLNICCIKAIRDWEEYKENNYILP